tara:strand:- start:217 stop:864 length:648 start_codon:yes stop_codon:yes gene_type:complete
MKRIKEILKKIVFRYLKLGGPSYRYNVEPIQLATLIYELDRLDSFKGNILEVGVARGMTTRFLCEHLKNNANFDGVYYAVDTFDSFTESDLAHEVESRGKKISEIRGFEYNDVNIWQSNFKDFPFVKAVKGDCSAIDYNRLSPIKLTFLDVDLYIPTLNALEKIYDCTVEGGVILVDDCMDNTPVDGALAAYNEFCTKKGIESKIIGNKCGIIYK